ncbi:MAG TPA: hypothetical protein VF176_02510 [Solirubrobacterales bacterium]
MRPHLKIALLTMALTLALGTATALAIGKPTDTPPHGNGQGNGPVYTPSDPGNPGDPTPGPKAGLPAQAKAYGRYCKEESRKHVKGEKGTPFSRCVTAMAKAANNENASPGQACKGLSRKHVKGEKGTPFSRCVKDAAHLRHDLQQDEE